jgi:hypothetical protein
MNVMDYIKGRRSKTDPIPGATEGPAGRKCPLCGKDLLKYRPCCGNPAGYIGCRDSSCGYKEAR